MERSFRWTNKYYLPNLHSFHVIRTSTAYKATEVGATYWIICSGFIRNSTHVLSIRAFQDGDSASRSLHEKDTSLNMQRIRIPIYLP
jgi:hypothetical protein